MSVLWILLAISLAWVPKARACVYERLKFDLPPASIPTQLVNQTNFNRLMGQVVQKYGPIFESHGLDFKLYHYWDNNYVYADARRLRPNLAVVSIYGGIARMPHMTLDGVLGVVCHEIGHHLGGYPFKGSRGVSTEGQADYYSTFKCIKTMLKGDPLNSRIARSLSLPASLKTSCLQQLGPSLDDYYICLRSAKASEAIAQALALNSKEGTVPSLAARDNNSVLTHFNDHPPAQCRLDTLVNGALCNREVDHQVIGQDATADACHPHLGDRFGTRPGCWFAYQ
jgi:hypothetical protein